MVLRILLPLSLVLLLLAPAGCGSSGGTSPLPVDDECIKGDGPEVVVTGTVFYERLVLTTLGLGPALEVRPARFVDVRLRLAGGGTCYGEGSADENGDFHLVVRPPAGSQIEIWAYSRTNNDPIRRVTVHDALPPTYNVHSDHNVFGYASASFTAGSTVPVVFTVPYNPGGAVRPSIGFGLMDVILTCTESIRTATGIVSPLCHAYTRLGNNGATGTSFYSTSACAFTMLGGASGNLDLSDTDYFDDGVIAHEFGHFVEHHLAHTLTRGGSHSGQALEPNFSWSEGQATGFGCLYRKTPAYIDTLGTSGGLLMSISVEDWPQQVRGIGGEETVAEIVWDLGDGAPGIPDTDGDVAAVSLNQILSAFTSFDPENDAPYIGLLLDRLVGAGSISSTDVATLLVTPENQQISYPLTGRDVWPVPVSAPGSASGIVDATIGNRCRGLAASTWYVVTLPAPSTVTFDLTVSPIPPSADDLNLVLLEMSGSTLASSVSGGAANERIGPIALAAGKYLVRVEANCAGAGSRAGYTLTLTVGS